MEVPPVCPICGKEGQNARLIGSASYCNAAGAPSGGSVWCEAVCTDCDVDLRFTSKKGVPSVWYLIAPEKSQLLRLLSNDEVEAITNKMQRYKAIGAKWNALLLRRRPGDEIWRYQFNDKHTGITVVRNGLPIACFNTIGSL